MSIIGRELNLTLIVNWNWIPNAANFVPALMLTGSHVFTCKYLEYWEYLEYEQYWDYCEYWCWLANMYSLANMKQEPFIVLVVCKLGIFWFRLEREIESLANFSSNKVSSIAMQCNAMHCCISFVSCFIVSLTLVALKLKKWDYAESVVS